MPLEGPWKKCNARRLTALDQKLTAACVKAMKSGWIPLILFPTQRDSPQTPCAMSRNLTVAARRVKHGQDRSSNVLGLRLDNRSSFLHAEKCN